MKTLISIKRGYDRFLDILDRGLSWLLIAMFVIITFQVLTRHFAPSPVTWPTDISSYMLVAIGFLAIGHLIRKNVHVAVDLLVSRFPEKLQDGLEIVFSIVSCAVCVVTCYGAVLMTQNLIQKNVLIVASTFYFPKYILLLFVVAGFAIASIEFIGRAVYYIRKVAGKLPPEPEDKDEPEPGKEKAV
jgi:TRAP-type C4-dicarboxylate transport system permease small subunit